MMQRLNYRWITVSLVVFFTFIFVGSYKCSIRVIEWDSYSGHQKTTLRVFGVFDIKSSVKKTIISDALDRSPSGNWVIVGEVPVDLKHGVFVYRIAYSRAKMVLRHLSDVEKRTEFLDTLLEKLQGEGGINEVSDFTESVLLRLLGQAEN